MSPMSNTNGRIGIPFLISLSFIRGHKATVSHKNSLALSRQIPKYYVCTKNSFLEKLSKFIHAANITRSEALARLAAS